MRKEDSPLDGMSVPMVEIRRTISVTFDPMPDITAYELAIILPFFHGRWMHEDDWNALGAAQRHLQRHD